MSAQPWFSTSRPTGTFAAAAGVCASPSAFLAQPERVVPATHAVSSSRPTPRIVSPLAPAGGGGARGGRGGGRVRRAQVLAVPGDIAVHPVFPEAGSGDVVRLARIDDELGVAPQTRERLIHLL